MLLWNFVGGGEDEKRRTTFAKTNGWALLLVLRESHMRSPMWYPQNTCAFFFVMLCFVWCGVGVVFFVWNVFSALFGWLVLFALFFFFLGNYGILPRNLSDNGDNWGKTSTLAFACLLAWNRLQLNYYSNSWLNKVCCSSNHYAVLECSSYSSWFLRGKV